MIHGKFLKVLANFDTLDLGTLRDISSELKDGYLKISWRDNMDILVGYLLAKQGSFRGAIVCDILTMQATLGEDAIPKIRKAITENKIHAVELYEADVSEILLEYPKSTICKDALTEEVRGINIKDIIKLLKQYNGEIEINADSLAWSLYIEKGAVKDAITTKGPKLYGDNALDELLYNMGNILKGGSYRSGRRRQVSSNSAVTKETVFIEGLELLEEKMKFEEKFSKTFNNF